MYSGWSSTPVRAPPRASKHDDEDSQGGDSPGDDIPCAQPPKPSPTFDLTFQSVKIPEEMPVTQTSSPAVVPYKQTSEPAAEPSLSWQMLPSTFSKEESQPAEPGRTNKVSQISAITTIEPTSSNEVSCSAQIPLAQKSFSNIEETQVSDQSASNQASNDTSLISPPWEIQSQFSELGDSVSVEEEDQTLSAQEEEGPVNEEHKAESTKEMHDNRSVNTEEHSSNVEAGSAAPLPIVDKKNTFGSVTANPSESTKLSLSSDRPENGCDFDDKNRPKLTPVDLRRLSSRFGRRILPLTRTPLPAAGSSKEGQPSSKRLRSEVESSAGGPSKRFKSGQIVRGEPLDGSLSRESRATPRTSDSFLEDSISSTSKNARRPPVLRPPPLVGNGRNLNLWPGLQRNPTQARRPISLMPESSDRLLRCLDMTKSTFGTKRSSKYRTSSQDH